jgi:hypothetical protein
MNHPSENAISVSKSRPGQSDAGCKGEEADAGEVAQGGVSYEKSRGSGWLCRSLFP